MFTLINIQSCILNFNFKNSYKKLVHVNSENRVLVET